MSAKLPRRPRSALTVIALILGVSGLIRLGGPAAAIAREVGTIQEPGASLSVATGGCESAEDVTLALGALTEREERVAAREEEIGKRLALLAEAESAMKATMGELEAAEAELDTTLAIASTAAEDDLSRLTTVYETMKPKEAAALFTEMDRQFAAGFLGRMRPDAAAAVLAGLDPQTGYTISVVLAARNASVPKH